LLPHTVAGFNDEQIVVAQDCRLRIRSGIASDQKHKRILVC